MLKLDFFTDHKDVTFAHTSKELKSEKLEEHMDLCFNVLLKINEEKNIFNIIKNMINKLNFHNVKNETLSDFSKELIYEMFINAIYLHDLGKLNPLFQELKMKNNLIEKYKYTIIHNDENTEHSTLSSALYTIYYFQELKKLKDKGKITLFERKVLNYLFINFSLVMAKHHGQLSIKNYKMKNSLYLDKDELFNNYFLKTINYPDILLFVKKDWINESYYVNTKTTKIKAQENLEKMCKFICNHWEYTTSKDVSFDEHSFYILSKLLNSLLVSADHIATGCYSNNRKLELIEFGTFNEYDKILFEDLFNNFEITKSINHKKTDKNFQTQDLNKITDINELRTKMYLEAEDNFLKCLDKNIFYLAMPTGGGKTNVSINLAIQALKNTDTNKIVYVFPFNTLVDQTFNEFKKRFTYKEETLEENTLFDIEVYNSITPVQLLDDEGNRTDDLYDTDFELSVLNRDIYGNKVVLTSHVALFRMLFNNSKGINPLWQLANSIIILDEIQSYRNSIWREIIEMLSKYAESLNFKIIIMSATLPNLEELRRDKKNDYQYLINEPNKYFKHNLFKDRVNIYDKYLKFNGVLRETDNRSLKEYILYEHKDYLKHSKNNGNTRILVEFIRKQSAKDFFKYIKEDPRFDKYDIYQLTGDDNRHERERVLKIIKNSYDNEIAKDILLVATQIIEAGVDIDMHLGFKDTSLLESEEQFMGRINRSNKYSDCKVFFFHMNEGWKIYRDDVRASGHLNINKEIYFNYLKDRNFEEYYNEIFKLINKEENMELFYDFLKNFCFDEVKKRMLLIKDGMISLFIDYTFEFEDGTSIRGKDVWQEYLDIVNMKITSFKDLQKQKVLKSLIQDKMNCFIFNVYIDNDLIDFLKNKRFKDKDLFYIENGDKYFKDGKFNIELLKDDKFSFLSI